MLERQQPDILAIATTPKAHLPIILEGDTQRRFERYCVKPRLP